MKPIIVVNATALEQSGGLAILKQFIQAVPRGEAEYIVFISNKIEINSPHDAVRIVPVRDVKPLYKRFIWDIWGMKKWLKKKRIQPYASLSLQNTGFRTGYVVPNYIYFHQSIPFSSQRWSLFRKEERVLWFYKYVYPFFVRLLLNEHTQIFVQLEDIKARFASYFRFPAHRIHVIAPAFRSSPENWPAEELAPGKIHLFYPATMHFYKNHAVLAEALKRLAGDRFLLHFTCTREECAVDTGGIAVECRGTLSREQMDGMYRAVDALVFPSYIETYGLPLLEAASAGLPVLAADLPYAREVLKGYEGAVFIDYADPEAWAEEIKKLRKGKKYPPFKRVVKDSWPELFAIINS